MRELTRRSVGRSLDDVIRELRSYLLGWKGYFRLAETPGVFKRRYRVNLLDDADTHELTPDQQASVLVGIEEADRGEVVSADEVMAALRAARTFGCGSGSGA